MKHKPLQDKFVKNGFSHKLLKREGDKAIFERKKAKFVHYEVILISRHDGYTLGESYIEPAETYPSSSQWGDKGWTFTSLEKAEQKFCKL